MGGDRNRSQGRGKVQTISHVLHTSHGWAAPRLPDSWSEKGEPFTPAAHKPLGTKEPSWGQGQRSLLQRSVQRGCSVLRDVLPPVDTALRLQMF